MAPRSSRSHFLHKNSHIDLCFLAVCIIVLLDHAAAAPAGPIIEVSPDTGNLTVFDPSTGQPIPQFPATDGGSGKIVVILWALFGITVGGPLGLLGVRVGRLVTGAACGFLGSVTIWAAFVNSLPMPLASTPNTADLILTMIFLVTFISFTFLGAFFRSMHPLGLGLLGATAGTSLFMRVVIFKKGLLISLYSLNLALLAVGAIFGGILIFWKRRLMVILATSITSTFLLGLSVDLILNMKAPQRQGMSRGLKLLMDRNPSHLADIMGTHYEPTLKTQVILGASFGLIPVLAYTQHRLFPGPFTYNLSRSHDEGDSSLYEVGPDFSPGRPLNMGAKGADIGQLPIGGSMFRTMEHGSRFST